MLLEQIEKLGKIKNNINPTTQEVIKTSRIRNLYRQSSAFYLWIITGILGYAHKLPIVRNIIGILSLWYGRTTWWTILLKLRKAFITFNALIGMYMVYKTTGFGFDNLLAGFLGMGHTYLEIFINFNKKLFNWLFNLFDHKVIPNIPNNPSLPSNSSNVKESWFPSGTGSINTGWTNKFTESTNLDSLRKNYKSVDEMFTNPFNVTINTTPWYRDLSTWLWIGGTLASVGLAYVGYKMIMDPLFIENLPLIGNWFNSTPGGNTGNVANAVVTVTTPEGSLTPTNIPQPEFVQGSSSSVTKSIITTIGGGLKKLNPATWFLSSVDYEAQKAAFEINQCSQGYDKRFYPFNPIHPYDGIIKRLRISIFGESYFERNTRINYRKEILDYLVPPLNITPTAGPSTPLTPTITTVGLGLNLTNMDTGFMTVASKLSSVTNTPTHLPVQLPEMDNAFNNPLGEALERLKGYVSPEVTSPRVEASSSVIKSSVITAPVTSPIVESIATLLSWFFKLK